MNLSDRVGLRFMKHLVATPAGRAHLLALVADSERNDEGRIFTALAKFESDATLTKVVRRHAADEEQHAAMLEARIVANGAGRPRIPKHLDLLGQLGGALDGLMKRPISSREGVMPAYLTTSSTSRAGVCLRTARSTQTPTATS